MRKVIRSFAQCSILARQIPLLCLFLMLPWTAAAQSWTWTPETVDVSATFTSLAVDHDGNIHVAYAAENGSVLKYAFRPAKSDHWFTMVLDKQLQNFTTFLALDPKGNPRICYTPRELKYAAWDGQAWKIQQIAPNTGSIEYNCTLVIGSDSIPHVIWYQTRTGDGSNYLHLKYATITDGVWMAKTVDFNGEDGKWNSIVLDSNGTPHLTYSVFPQGQLKYAAEDRGEWKVQVAATSQSASAGMGNSLVLDAHGQPQCSFYEGAIGYESSSSGAMKFARRTEKGWSVETVDNVFQKGSWVGFRSSLVLDKSGNPHISYEDGGSLKHAYWDGAKWHKQVIAPRAVEPYLYSSMAIGPDGSTLYVSYRDPADGSLKVAIGRNPSESESTAMAPPKEKTENPNNE
ncbi:MAG TPA: hypothetical protein VJP87_01615 [Candidatus Acidoferrales bacterium]|nr:hypothetical protein [Candidatus Acidoferrales bacterium]